MESMMMRLIGFELGEIEMAPENEIQKKLDGANF